MSLSSTEPRLSCVAFSDPTANSLLMLYSRFHTLERCAAAYRDLIKEPIGTTH
ncbi:MAG: hypothetical protein ACLP0J_06065 [Solirubrobacteraceae bacterium]|jgi:hypothetical protein